jgi:hypothetical protein
MTDIRFKGAAKRIDDIDLPRIGSMIGVGEDVIHAVMDVESRGYGFDKQGRVLALFEPHVFWRNLSGSKRAAAARAGLAYAKWKPGAYPADSYPRILAAVQIDEEAALKSASWGLGQILGENHKAAGYPTARAMVEAFADDEEAHLAAMVEFIKTNGLDRALRRLDWAAFARGYNGPAFAKNDYHNRLARRYAHWQRIPDTPWNPRDALKETRAVEGKGAPVGAPAPKPAPEPASAPPANEWGIPDDGLPGALPVGRSPITPQRQPAPSVGLWGRFMSALRGN